MTPDKAKQRLAELRKQIKGENSARSKRTRRLRGARRSITAKSVAIGAGRIAVVTAIPFLLYVRSSVFFYEWLGGAPWVAVAGGLALTLMVVAAYASWLVHGVFGKSEWASIARKVAAPIVGAWLLYSLLFVARVNAKSDDVREWYRDLHPVLRVAVSTAIIVDPNMVITDMQRVSGDYPRMGLPVNTRTRHYVQKDGWVHAVDLRTIGRNEARNRLLQFYFWSMGFSTTRHVGTADHLHVQLR
jgi:hypothetical protein